MTIEILDSKRLATAVAAFKDSTAYRERLVQTNFCAFARSVLGHLLRERPVWEERDLTAMIAVFKCPKDVDRFVGRRFERNLDKLGFSTEIHNKILDEFRVLQQKGEVVGYTGVGKGGIVGLSPTDVAKVREFFQSLYVAESYAAVRKAVEVYTAAGIPQVTEGIYSPWAHYLQPKFCPIINKRSRGFLKDIEYSWEDYAELMGVFGAMGKEFGMEDLGLVDEFIKDEHTWRRTLTEIVRVRK